MSYSIIAAIGKNNELGRNNDLIWRLPNDLKFFRKMTTGKSIIMGRKTFESLPHLLPNRHHIILSSSNSFPSEVDVYKSIKEILLLYKNDNSEKFIIGGASVYKAFLEYCDKMYLTEIDEECKDADVYFPRFNYDDWNSEILNQENENGISYKHVLYTRKK